MNGGRLDYIENDVLNESNEINSPFITFCVKMSAESVKVSCLFSALKLLFSLAPFLNLWPHKAAKNSETV